MMDSIGALSDNVLDAPRGSEEVRIVRYLSHYDGQWIAP
jgi:hypothetical protein